LLIVLKKVSHGRSSLAKLATHSQMLQQGVPLRALRLEQVIAHNASANGQVSSSVVSHDSDGEATSGRFNILGLPLQLRFVGLVHECAIAHS